MNYNGLGDAIADYEYYLNGFQKLANASVRAEVTSIDTPDEIDSEDVILIHADVTLHEDNKTTTYSDCTYDLTDMVARAIEMRKQNKTKKKRS